MRGVRATALAFVLAASAACGPRAPKPLPVVAPQGGAVAQVGEESISPSLVEAVAGAEAVPPRTALKALVDDALAARGARDRGLDRDPAVGWAEQVALARLVPAWLAAGARALGPPTDDELGTLTVVHAVVLRAPGLAWDRAAAVAATIAHAVDGARSAEDFLARVKALPWQHARVVAETVGPFAIDGRAPTGELDKEFVAGAFALKAPLQQSPVVTTSFGWHVIMLVSRSPPGDVTVARREELAAAAVEARARIRLDDVLRARRGRTPIDVARDAETNMAAAVEALPP